MHPFSKLFIASVLLASCSNGGPSSQAPASSAQQSSELALISSSQPTESSEASTSSEEDSYFETRYAFDYREKAFVDEEIEIAVTAYRGDTRLSTCAVLIESVSQNLTLTRSGLNNAGAMMFVATASIAGTYEAVFTSNINPTLRYTLTLTFEEHASSSSAYTPTEFCTEQEILDRGFTKGYQTLWEQLNGQLGDRPVSIAFPDETYSKYATDAASPDTDRYSYSFLALGDWINAWGDAIESAGYPLQGQIYEDGSRSYLLEEDFARYDFSLFHWKDCTWLSVGVRLTEHQTAADLIAQGYSEGYLDNWSALKAKLGWHAFDLMPMGKESFSRSTVLEDNYVYYGYSFATIGKYLDEWLEIMENSDLDAYQPGCYRYRDPWDYFHVEVGLDRGVTYMHVTTAELQEKSPDYTKQGYLEDGWDSNVASALSDMNSYLGDHSVDLGLTLSTSCTYPENDTMLPNNVVDHNYRFVKQGYQMKTWDKLLVDAGFEEVAVTTPGIPMRRYHLFAGYKDTSVTVSYERGWTLFDATIRVYPQAAREAVTALRGEGYDEDSYPENQETVKGLLGEHAFDIVNGLVTLSKSAAITEGGRNGTRYSFATFPNQYDKNCQAVTKAGFTVTQSGNNGKMFKITGNDDLYVTVTYNTWLTYVIVTFF
ncbi:MAG: hypothetical protein J5736_03020 [Bacilli bacterium]|nr:hypothetical protein [Bacilli bacterium]